MLTGFKPLNLHTRYLLLNEGAEGEPAGGSGGTGTATVAFTPEQQAHIDKVIAAEKAKAARSASTATKAEVDAYLAEQKRTADLAEADELTRTKAERDQALAKAAEAEATSARTAAEARAQAALLAAGMPANAVTDGLRLIDIDPADDAAALLAKADALKSRLPALFTPPAGSTPPPAPGFAGAKPPAGGPGADAKTGEARARDLAASLGITLVPKSA